ncbi:hypothetical protein MASR1M36_04100 [Candidatus Cloacimonadaceae bacterium]
MHKVLITGITGLIGRRILSSLLMQHPEWQFCALIRPQTTRSRLVDVPETVRLVEIDLADTNSLKEFLFTNDFDTIVHIGALRGGRRATRQDFIKSNLFSTAQMVEYCLAKEARLIFCSSVGVYGAIPKELPAGMATEKNPDNYYHYTKIEAEKVINKAVLTGLKAAIVRPSITYGTRDRGFPYQLVKLVHHHRFPLINKRTWIHLCNIEALVRAFSWLADNNWRSGLTLNVADREPIQLHALVDFISRQLHNRNYPAYLRFDRRFFSWGEKTARLMGNELWTSRFELISKSWFYDVSEYYQIMESEGHQPHYTIPEFKLTIEDYLKN